MFFQPYSDHRNDPLGELRAITPSIVAPVECTQVKDITAVGARCFYGVVANQDQSYLRRIFRLFGENGVPISRDFNLRIQNIHQDPLGDFLRYPHKSDLVVICFVHNGVNAAQDGLFNKSDLHFVPGAWHDAAIQSKAKFIVTFGDYPLEITAPHFRARKDQSQTYLQMVDTGCDEGVPYINMLVRADVAPKYPSLGRLQAII